MMLVEKSTQQTEASKNEVTLLRSEITLLKTDLSKLERGWFEKYGAMIVPMVVSIMSLIAAFILFKYSNANIKIGDISISKQEYPVFTTTSKTN